MSDRLENLARQLGARAAERLDVEATARKVVERLREQPAERRVWIHKTWLRIAAAVVLLVGGVVVASRLTPGRRPGVSPTHLAHLVADDLDDLSTDQLRNVLTTLDDIVSGDSVVSDSTADLHELDTQQLRTILREG
jgi:hypothetical protein